MRWRGEGERETQRVGERQREQQCMSEREREQEQELQTVVVRDGRE